MCGIAGIISPDRSPGDREQAVAAMCASMVHRGPDDGGWTTQGPATIGMRRLAIFDPANGRQPMTTPDGRHSIVFNGAIYNHRELRAVLEPAGAVFRTHCDTEVLLAAFAHWGAGCLRRLRGMFAFAVWDRVEQSLFLARDAFGIKPLYFCRQASDLLFASELNALAASGWVSTEIDPLSVADYLGWLAVPAPRTIHKQVSLLKPGQWARFRDGSLELQTWWSLRDAGRGSFGSADAGGSACATRDEFVGQLRGRLDDTIRAHLLADVPVGAFLSGGLDSAIIAGLMVRAGATRLKTFSIAFGEAEFSESEPAAATARFLGTEHQETVLTGGRVAADIDRIVACLDQPTGDGINTYYASELARAGGVTAALSGLGGDELFGGYPSFRQIPLLARWMPLWRRLPGFARRIVTSRLSAGGTRSRKLADLLRYGRTTHEIASLQRRVFSEPGRLALLSRDLRREVQARGVLHPSLDALALDLPRAGPLDVACAWELATYMADLLLRDSDTMSMRHSLELRVPFVDGPLVDWLWNQPAAFRFDARQPKSSLAAAAADVLAPGVMERRKRGFTLPFAVWMRRELRPFLEDTFAPANVARTGLLSVESVRSCWLNFMREDDPRDWSRVWSLAILVAFLNRKTPAPSAPAPAAALNA